MRFDASALLLGAGVVSAAAPPYQQILKLPKHGVESLSEPLHQVEDQIKSAAERLSTPFHEIEEQLESLSDEARLLWEEFSLPKQRKTRPVQDWDYVVRGADVQDIWVTGANGDKEREIDGRLETYDLRVKNVDTSALGIDPDVKQFSGYLDDNENDKHLFYCK